MPRETVFSPHPSYPGSGPPPFQMQVGWQRDRDVQVGISTPDNRYLIDYLYGDVPTLDSIGRGFAVALGRVEGEHGDDLVAALHVYQSADDSDVSDAGAVGIGRAVLNVVTGSSHALDDSVWWHPGRHEINVLIRLLRKARDAAYGRDE